MKKNEWATIKALLGMEIDRVAKDDEELKKALNGLYFDWTAKVERHVWITESGEPRTPQELEIMNGFAEAHDIPPLSHSEIEILQRLFQRMRAESL